MDIFSNLIVVVVTWSLTFIITHRTVLLKRVNFTDYKLCLNKLDSPQKKKKAHCCPNTRYYPSDIIRSTFSRNSEMSLWNMTHVKKKKIQSRKDQIRSGKYLSLGYLSFEKSISTLQWMLCVRQLASPTGKQLTTWTIWEFSLSSPAFFFFFLNKNITRVKRNNSVRTEQWTSSSNPNQESLFSSRERIQVFLVDLLLAWPLPS